MKLKAVVFDVDGTLVDSNDSHVEAWREAFRAYGKRLSRDDIHAQLGKGGDQLMPVFLSGEELAQFGEELERLRVERFVHKYLPKVAPFPRVRELFERLRKDGKQVVLASSAKEAELRRHVDALGVGRLVSAATSADAARHSKPCPDIFQAALARLEGVTPGEAIVVGDTPYDAQAATRAGMPMIGVRSGGFSETALYAAGAVAVYRDIAELLDRYSESPLAGERVPSPAA